MHWSTTEFINGYTPIYSVWEYKVDEDDGERLSDTKQTDDGFPKVRTKKMTQGVVDPFSESPDFQKQVDTRQTNASRYSDDV